MKTFNWKQKSIKNAIFTLVVVSDFAKRLSVPAMVHAILSAFEHFSAVSASDPAYSARLDSQLRYDHSDQSLYEIRCLWNEKIFTLKFS